jgi:hypothetical protein
MASAPKYDMTVHPTAGLVRSQSDGARAHQVTLSSCDCPDYVNRKGRLVEVDGGIAAVTVCKHIAEFLVQAGGWHRPAALPLNQRDRLGVSFERARTLLAEAGIDDAKARSVLHSIRVQHGRDTLRLPESGSVLVTYNELTDRYDVRLLQQSGLNVTQAFETLVGAAVNGGEAERALREAQATGSAYAARPGLMSAVVRHEGSKKTGLFSVEFPA